jgi:hypothetical protein
MDLLKGFSEYQNGGDKLNTIPTARNRTRKELRENRQA